MVVGAPLAAVHGRDGGCSAAGDVHDCSMLNPILDVVLVDLCSGRCSKSCSAGSIWPGRLGPSNAIKIRDSRVSRRSVRGAFLFPLDAFGTGSRQFANIVGAS